MATYYLDENGELKKEETKKEKKNKKKGTTYVMNEDGYLVPEESEERTWFQAGAMSDGVSLKNIGKTVLGTATDLVEDAATGIIGMGEQALDAMLTAAPYIAQGQYYQNGGVYQAPAQQATFESYIQAGKERNAEIVEMDLYDEKAVAQNIITNPIQNATGINVEEASVLGDKSDALVQSGGQLLATAGLQAVGVPWWLTTGATSFGGETENALKEGASVDAASTSALISTGAEILTEKLSGGIKFGGETLDDILIKPLTEKISNKVVQSLVDLGVEAVGEGVEEAVSSFISNLGSKLYKEEKLNEILFSEEALDEYIESFIGGAVLGGGSSAIHLLRGGNVEDTKTQNETEVSETVEESAAAPNTENDIAPIAPLPEFTQMENAPGETDAVIGPLPDAVQTEESTELEDIAPLPESERAEQTSAISRQESIAPISQEKIKENYSQSEDKSFYQFIVDAIAGKLPKKSFHKFSKRISDRMARDIEKIVGFSVKEYGNEISPSSIRHINKEHGANGRSDSSMRNYHDLARLTYVINNYDNIREGKRSEEYRNSDGTFAKTVELQKKIDDGFYYVVEAVPDAKNKTLHVVSAYINKKDTFSDVLVSNDPKRYVQDEHQPNVPSNDIISQSDENTTEKSLDDTSQDIAPIGDYHVYGKDIALEQNSVPENIAPLSQRTETVSKENETESRPIAPLPEKVAPVQQDIDYAPIREDLQSKPVETVKERNAAKLQNYKLELQNNEALREEAHQAYNKQIAELQAEYEAKKNKNTKVANEILQRIERTKRLRDNTDAVYEKRISDLKSRIDKMQTKEFKIAEQRQTKQEEYRTRMGELMGDTSTWVDKKMGISYKVNTLRRNLRDIVRKADGSRDIERADAIYDELQGTYNRNEAKLNREANAIKEKFRRFKINAAEDKYIQMLGEYRDNPDTKILADEMTKFFEAHKNQIDTEKVDKVIARARELYDELFSRVNDVLREQGMKEIPYRKGYFPHFIEEAQPWWAKILGWKEKNHDIPTDLAGLTEQFNPDRSWQSFNKHRTGDKTTYGFTKGLDMHVNGVLDWIYHIPDIQKRRAFENEIRYRHSEQGRKDRADALRANEEYSAEEMQEQLDLIYAEAANPLNNFVTDFRTQTNTLAGKKSSMDRGMEEYTNRKFYSVMTNASNRVTANMVAGSVSSALTNFIPITQSWGQVSPVSSLRAMGDTIRSTFRDDGTIDKSDFLTNRLRKNKNLNQTFWDKASEKVGILMEAVDSFTSQTVWRSKYLENISSGMSENAAIKDADQFAENVIAGRSRGNQPTIFDAKNPLIKIFTAFQLEVNNQYGYMFKDMPQDVKNQSKAKLIKGYTTMFLGAYAYNALYSSLTGRDAAFDPIGIIEELLTDLGWIGDDEEELTDTITNLTDNILDEVPFVSGLVGGGRIPISSALPYGEGVYEMFTGTKEDIEEGDKASLTKEWLNPVYYLAMPFGGGQLRKTVQGLSMFSDEHPVAGSYTDSGNLRFPVEDTVGSKIKAGIFGQWANDNAQNYLENGRKPLEEKQIEEYKELGLPIEEYWDYRDGLAKLSTLEEKFDYIAGLNVTAEQRNIMINNIVDRKEPVDMSNYDDFENYEEFDWYIKNTEKYEFLQSKGVSYMQYKESEESKELYNKEYEMYRDNPEKYAFLEERGVSFAQYRESDESKDRYDGEYYLYKNYPEKYDFLEEIGVSYEDYDKTDESRAAYNWAYNNQDAYRMSQIIEEDVVKYKQITSAINNIRADKDKEGNAISGSAKRKKIEYINSLDMDYGQKIILFRSVFESDDTYNRDIVEYLNGRKDITYKEKEHILKELGFTVQPDGTIGW